MILTGKCLEDFRIWYKNNFLKELPIRLMFPYSIFYNYILQSMQYGVYVDFFDSVGIYISIMASHSHYVASEFHGFDICVEGNGFCYDIDSAFKQRQEARKQSIIKANEIYNKHKYEKV